MVRYSNGICVLATGIKNIARKFWLKPVFPGSVPGLKAGAIEMEHNKNLTSSLHPVCEVWASFTIMKKISVLLLVAALIVSVPHVSFAWGKVGHGIVAEIAFSFLDKGTKEKIHKYLGKTSIEGASTWMDELRNDHRYDYMKPWHYVNIPKGKEYTET